MNRGSFTQLKSNFFNRVRYNHKGNFSPAPVQGTGNQKDYLKIFEWASITQVGDTALSCRVSPAGPLEPHLASPNRVLEGGVGLCPTPASPFGLFCGCDFALRSTRVFNNWALDLRSLFAIFHAILLNLWPSHRSSSDVRPSVS